jgi:hypothetical protein
MITDQMVEAACDAYWTPGWRWNERAFAAMRAALEAAEAADPPDLWRDTVRDLFDACQFGLPTHTWIIKFIEMRHPEYFCAPATPKETT